MRTGLWGAKIFQNRQSILSVSIKMYNETEHEMKYGFDQRLLHKLFWPLAINDSVHSF